MLKETKAFTHEPILNQGDFYINMWGGFKGLLARIKYINRALNLSEIQSLAKDCPNAEACGIDADCPPYLDTDWWFNS